MPRQRDGGWSHDQAAGLRRMLVPHSASTIAFFGARAGAGTTTIATRCALALSESERSVLLVDERGGGNGVAAMLGVASRFDLLQAMEDHVSLSQATLALRDRLGLIHSARAVLANAESDAPPAHAWARAIEAIRRSAAAVIVDAAASAEQPLSPFALAAERLVVVVGRGPAAATDSYGLIKRLAYSCQSRRIGIVAAKTRSWEEAYAIFENLRRVAVRHLDLGLDLLGHVPFDPQWRARHGRDPLASDGSVGYACEQIAASLCIEVCEAHAVAAVSGGEASKDAPTGPRADPSGRARTRNVSGNFGATG